MIVVAIAVAAVHTLASLMIGLYAMSQLHLLWTARRATVAPPPPVQGDEVPAVTVQLPIYNERRGVRELLRTVAHLDWPRLTIQVLDDSTDETVQIAAETCRELQAEGVRIHHLRRSDRSGYKAGALAWGLTQTSDPFVAIFDADFRPPADFLRRAMAPLLQSEDLGLLQARWGHTNRQESPFTQALAFHLDAHFSIEQVARSQSPLLMGFNGTAGVWRRACIDAGGGWSGDTLTEDLDLSIRAQLAGWQLGYADELEAPAELPAHVRAIRSQQHRWMKGGAQVGRKLTPRLWASDRPLVTKVQSTVHMGGGAVFAAVLILCITTPMLAPLMTIEPVTAQVLMPATGLLQVALGSLILFYGAMCWRREKRATTAMIRLAVTMPIFLCMSTGLALHNVVAVAEGWLGMQSPFIRTPKRGDSSDDGAHYVAEPIGWTTIAEVALGAWGTVGAVWAFGSGQWILGAFLVSQAVGFLSVGIASLVRR